MRYSIGLSGDEIEIGQYHEVNRGVLKAYFSLIIYPRGQKILNCQYMVSDKRIWFMFPFRELQKEGEKYPDKIPYVSYLDKEYKDELVSAVLKGLKDQKPMDKHGKTQSYQKKNALQAESFSDTDEVPF